jgi:hypothetical protein
MNQTKEFRVIHISQEGEINRVVLISKDKVACAIRTKATFRLGDSFNSKYQINPSGKYGFKVKNGTFRLHHPTAKADYSFEGWLQDASQEAVDYAFHETLYTVYAINDGKGKTIVRLFEEIWQQDVDLYCNPTDVILKNVKIGQQFPGYFDSGKIEIRGLNYYKSTRATDGIPDSLRQPTVTR